MNPLIQLKKAGPVFLVALVCFGLLPTMRAVSPAPDGGYPGGNTAEGQAALLSLTTGGFNTAVGFLSARSLTTGSFNTAVGAGTLLANTADQTTATGAGALLSNTTGQFNTADGAFALFSNTTGHDGTGIGLQALFSNTIGSFNTATGSEALLNNTTGSLNTAIGASSLIVNTTGSSNTANGTGALSFNTTGANNMATGGSALGRNTTGNSNTATGNAALVNNTSGSNNIALGALAGQNLTTGDYNIDIGNGGVAGEGHTIRIGDDNQGATFIAGVYGVSVAGLGVAMNSSGQLGTVASSRRFKKDIKAMKQASETILSLEPVTFRYKKEIDPAGTSQFGLVAEDVEKVNPDLIVRDKEGKPYSVRYDQVNAMLLNEFLKEHKKTEKLEATVANLIATVKEQAAQIQKVSAQLEASKLAPQVAENNK
jgi:trimeric autotransporter adhesin